MTWNLQNISQEHKKSFLSLPRKTEITHIVLGTTLQWVKRSSKKVKKRNVIKLIDCIRPNIYMNCFARSYINKYIEQYLQQQINSEMRMKSSLHTNSHGWITDSQCSCGTVTSVVTEGQGGCNAFQQLSCRPMLKWLVASLLTFTDTLALFVPLFFLSVGFGC